MAAILAASSARAYFLASKKFTAPGAIKKSVDDGQTWTTVYSYPSSAMVTICAASGGDRMAIARDSHVFWSSDYGESWSDIGASWAPLTSSVSKVVWAEGTTFVAITDTGVYRSTNSGLSWGLVTDPVPLNNFDIIYLGSGVMLLGGGTDYYTITYPYFTRDVIARSTDYGSTWTLVLQTPVSTAGNVACFASDGAGNIMAGGMINLNGTDNLAALWTSADNGLTWSSHSIYGGAVASGVWDFGAAGQFILVIGYETSMTKIGTGVVFTLYEYLYDNLLDMYNIGGGSLLSGEGGVGGFYATDGLTRKSNDSGATWTSYTQASPYPIFFAPGGASAVADFSGTPTSGNANLTVQFTDSSTGASSWLWNFGDSSTSTDQNPEHTYTKAGTFTVSLTISGGAASETKTGYITVAPVSEFSGTPTSGSANFTVQFTDESLGEPTSWLWVFGDGKFSNEQNPIHTYNTPRDYTVSLTVTDSYSLQDTETKIDYIKVCGINLVVNFVGVPREGEAPLVVDFTNLTVVPDRHAVLGWEWSFGDGETSTEMNPTHAYFRGGYFTVTLRAFIKI
jgi:PKD repeat protein